MLASMGLPLEGDYSGLGAGDSSISQVVQQVVMKVDLAGTRAAAATGVAVGTALRVGGATLAFDRPFLFMVIDSHTGTPLFLARVTDPTAS
jgi:serpin B